jgi:hypothetical protein
MFGNGAECSESGAFHRTSEDQTYGLVVLLEGVVVQEENDRNEDEIREKEHRKRQTNREFPPMSGVSGEVMSRGRRCQGHAAFKAEFRVIDFFGLSSFSFLK